ncbi:VRR-NUC domain-containing protein [Endozoicomonas sp. OPT23]|uniref:VRR-NUC domain-containing protein n=1 Tax=Endozoicomonas sp. OPT23 TaxID=2072845 RepID=UPI00129A7638|nr:VRR-NUC domain-containing protein [Endozoicomonas sp. OPT23]MRI32878.1 VRR-NUC domain-containing protein [Endozoicomonas sp. OPT23]
MAAEPANIPDDYYLTNFQLFLGFVADQYDDLLNAEEKSFLEHWFSLGDEPRKLYVRLISRKGQFFRADKLSYEEIDRLDFAAQQLADQRLLVINPALTVNELAGLLTKPELVKQFRTHLNGHQSKKKSELVSILVDQNITVPELPFIVYKPEFTLEITSFKFLFFGNLYQNLTEFVLSDLGITQYEKYPLNKQNRLFKNREQMEEALALSEVAAIAAEAEYNRDTGTLISLVDEIPAKPDQSLMLRRYSRLINRVARELERQQSYSSALELFQQSSMPPARERMARILDKKSENQAAIRVCQQIIEQPFSDMELAFAQRFISKFNGEKPRRNRRQYPEVYIALAESDQRVELIALDYYQQQGWQAFYAENSLISGLAGLYFWDVIFADIKDAFFHPFQSAPADLMTNDFYQKRSLQIKERIIEINQNSFKSKVIKTYRDKQGIANRLVHWSVLTEEMITLACDLIPEEHFKAVFGKLMFDIAHNRTGFPDLILFKPETGEYRWSEVKGPGDKLQENQKRWLDFFTGKDIPFEVLYVEWG